MCKRKGWWVGVVCVDSVRGGGGEQKDYYDMLLF